MSDVFDRGFIDTIRVEIPAVVFGRWAAHPSVDWPWATARTVDGDAHAEDCRIGWTVTHVRTGRTIEASVMNGLSQTEAEVIACALHDAQIDPVDGADWYSSVLVIEAVIAQALAEIDDGEVAP